MTRLGNIYETKVFASLKQEFGYSNVMQVPRLRKIVINMGVGEGSKDKGKIEAAVNEMTLIAGQRPIVTKARKSIAGFKIRDGMPIGVKVTLRKDRMYEFMDRLVTIAMPRLRDFRGLSAKSFDGRGNYNMGLKEQLVFPEIDYDKVADVRGMDITFVTSAQSDAEAKTLLAGLGIPFHN